MDNIKKGQTLSEGAFILVLTATITKAIGALFKLPLASEICLGDLGFGYFSAAYDLISPIILLAVSGLPVAVSKIISGYNTEQSIDKINSVFIMARRLFFAAGLILTSLSLLIIVIMLTSGNFALNDTYCYLAIIPSLLLCALTSAYRGYFEGITNMIYPAVSSLIEALCKLFLGFSFAFITVKTIGNVVLASSMALLGITLGTLFSFIYLHISYKSQANDYKIEKSSKNETKELIRKISVIALPIALYSLSGSVVGLIDSITVRPQLTALFRNNFSYFNGIFADIIGELNSGNIIVDKLQMPTLLYGIRSKAYTLYNIIPTFAAFLGASAVPHISRAFKLKDFNDVKGHILKIVKITAFISIPAGIGFIVLSEEIMFLLFSNSPSSAVGGKMLVFYGIATSFSGISIVTGNILQAIDKQNKALINLGFGVAVKILLNLILCSIIDVNIYGCAISTMICYTVIFTLNFISLKNYMKEATGIFLKLIVAAVACGIAAFTISLLGNSSLITLLSIAVAVIVYFCIVAAFKVFTNDELREIPVLGRYFRSKIS